MKSIDKENLCIYQSGWGGEVYKISEFEFIDAFNNAI